MGESRSPRNAFCCSWNILRRVCTGHGRQFCRPGAVVTRCVHGAPAKGFQVLKSPTIARVPASARRHRHLPGVAAALGIAAISTAALAATPGSETDRLQEAWRSAIANTPVPQEGCFTASYPVAAWKPVACVTAPAIPLIPRSGRSLVAAQTVGDGNDYSAVVRGLISKSVGSFPATRNLKTETGEGQANSYSLQLNSQFFANSPACAGSSDPAKCQGWQQFAYLPGFVFMQYWLINYANTCPSGWASYGADCYTNSASVSAPEIVITKLKTVSISATAVSKGIDTLVFSTKTKAYTTTGKDSVVGLADYWNASEWGIFGPGGGSAAIFNKGASITVNIALSDGSTKAPVCKPKDGTTGETNNLDLGPCTASGGKVPSVQFTESLKQ